METRDQIETEIADLRSQRGFAHLHGKKFDDATIAQAQQKLDALVDVEAAKHEQGRTEATQQHELEVATVRTELADLDASMTKALAEAETSLRVAAKAMRLHHQHAAAKRKAQARLRQLTGEQLHIEVEPEMHKKCSALWLAQIKTITGHLGRYGHITIPGMLATDPNKSWT